MNPHSAVFKDQNEVMLAGRCPGCEMGCEIRGYAEVRSGPCSLRTHFRMRVLAEAKRGSGSHKFSQACGSTVEKERAEGAPAVSRASSLGPASGCLVRKLWAWATAAGAQLARHRGLVTLHRGVLLKVMWGAAGCGCR